MSREVSFNPEQYHIPTNAAWHNVPAVNTAATVTLAAVATRRHCIYKLLWSYNAVPAGGVLTVYSGGVRIYHGYITNGGPGFIPAMFKGRVGANLVINNLKASVLSGNFDYLFYEIVAVIAIGPLKANNTPIYLAFDK